MDHISEIRARIVLLEEELRSDPRVRAVEHLKAALAALDGTPQATSGSTAAAGPAAGPTLEIPNTTNNQQIPKVQRMVAIVGGYLDEHGPTHRSVLIKELASAGLFDNVKNPTRRFATVMNTLKDKFVSDGKGTFRRSDGATDDPAGRRAVPPEGETGGVAPPASVAEHHDRKRNARDVPEAGGT